MPTTPRREATRRKLVAAALEIVAKQGFHAASVDAIAARAGYSIGALYSNFKGKDDLFFAVIDEHVTWFEGELEAAMGADDPVRAFGEWMDRLSTDPVQFLVFVEFWAYAVRRPKTRRQLATRMSRMRERVREMFGDDALALIALATARGLTLEKLADPDAVPPDFITQLTAATLAQRTPDASTLHPPS